MLEFIDALSALKVDVTREEASAIFSKYDKDGVGELDYNDFLFACLK